MVDISEAEELAEYERFKSEVGKEPYHKNAFVLTGKFPPPDGSRLCHLRINHVSREKMLILYYVVNELVYIENMGPALSFNFILPS